MNLHDRFEQFDHEFLKFELVQSPKSQRRDLVAFMLLDSLVPDSGALISASEHDEYFLDTDCEALNAIATDDQIRDLVRCGVRHSREYDCLCMFA